MDSPGREQPPKDGLRPTVDGVRKGCLRRKCSYCHLHLTTSFAHPRYLDQNVLKNRPHGIHNAGEIRRQRGEAIPRPPTQHSAAKRQKESLQLTGTSTLEARGTSPATIDLSNGEPSGGLVNATEASEAKESNGGVIPPPTAMETPDRSRGHAKLADPAKPEGEISEAWA
jgi:hypothetical protein